MKEQCQYEFGNLDEVKWLCLVRERMVNIKFQKVAVLSQALVQTHGVSGS